MHLQKSGSNFMIYNSFSVKNRIASKISLDPCNTRKGFFFNILRLILRIMVRTQLPLEKT